MMIRTRQEPNRVYLDLYDRVMSMEPKKTHSISGLCTNQDCYEINGDIFWIDCQDIRPFNEFVKAVWGEDGITFCHKEFEERLKKITNPGSAWKIQKKEWRKYFSQNGKFYYTYSERLNNKWDILAETIHTNPDSRRCFLNVWESKDSKNMSTERVPCTIGYQFYMNGGRLNMIHIMRSLNIYHNMCNDLLLDFLTLQFVSNISGNLMGEIGVFSSSIHLFEKDLKKAKSLYGKFSKKTGGRNG